MRKCYCYVDETGQDTKGSLFLVSVVIVQSDRNEIQLSCSLHVDQITKPQYLLMGYRRPLFVHLVLFCAATPCERKRFVAFEMKRNL